MVQSNNVPNKPEAVTTPRSAVSLPDLVAWLARQTGQNQEQVLNFLKVLKHHIESEVQNRG